MDSDSCSALGHINRGIAFHAAKSLDEARDQFVQAILKEPDNEHAWLWLAELSDDPGEQRYCLEQALEINPESPARIRLGGPAANPSVVPAALSDIAKPVTPPSLQPRHGPISSSRWRRNLIALVSGIRVRLWELRHRLPQWSMWGLLGLVIVLSLGLWLIVAQPWEDEKVNLVAVVGPLSGPESAIGEEMLHGAQLAVSTLNAAGGRPLALVVFDTGDDPNLAIEIAREVSADERFLAVIDFSSSEASLASAPIYDDAGIATISARAAADDLERYTSHFQLTINFSTEGAMLAQYAAAGLQQTRASMIIGPGTYEQKASDAFSKQFSANGDIVQSWSLAGDQREASIAAIVEGLQATPDPGIVFLALTDTDARDVLIAIRRAGLLPALLGLRTQSEDHFGAAFSGEPEEQEAPGFFTENLVAAVPGVFQDIGGEAVVFARTYYEAFGIDPGWRSAKGYDAVLAVDSAIRSGPLTNDIPVDRLQVIANLRAIDAPELALRGITGPIFFNDKGFVPHGLAIAEYVFGELVSAPIQYRLVIAPEKYDLDADLESGRAYELNGRTFRQFRVVYVGVEMIELRDMQAAEQSFSADFFIYLRYAGDDLPENVVFTNATTELALGDPLHSSVDPDGFNYRLFRVRGTFSEAMDFSRYPWDRHLLTIRFENQTEEETDLIYVPDPAILATSQAERLESGFDFSQPFNQIQSWSVTSVDFAHLAVSATSDEYNSPEVVRYSQFRVMLELERDVQSFLIKNLLPLALLTMVTYVSLWFSPEQASNRITFSITSLLAAAVMLTSISGNLPDIGYTVAIEWCFYAYIAVSAILALLNIAIYRCYRDKRFERVRQIDTMIRTCYPLAVLGIVVTYYVKFG